MLALTTQAKPLPLSPSAPLGLAANPLLQPGPKTMADVEADLQHLPHLSGDRRHVRRNVKAELREAVQAKTAAEALGRIPGPDAAVHMLVSGRFALWDFVPAILQMTGGRIEALTIATLGFSRRNITKLAELVDAGQIASVRLLFSHYFRGTSGTLCEYIEEQFRARADRMQYLSVRTHAKILLLAMESGERLTLESSANLRSCKNLEQVSAFGDPGLHAFHSQWIADLFHGAKAKG